MKSLENKSTSIGITGADGKLTPDKITYADLIRKVCNSRPQNGYDMNDITMRTKIMEAASKAKKTIELEDSRVDYLRAITKTMRWDFLHADLVTFAEDVAGKWTLMDKKK